MKIAIVTGASSGMGREFIRQIANRFKGLDEIWAIARREERLEELKEEILVPLRPFSIDLTDHSELMELQSALEEERPDV